MTHIAPILSVIAFLILAYLIGHKRGMREGVELGKSFGALDKPSPTIEQLRDLLAPILREQDPQYDLIRLDKYSIGAGGVIYRGRLEIATADDDCPFEFEWLQGVKELPHDREFCRKLSRLWFEKFGFENGEAVRNGDYFISREGLFWKGDFAFGRLGKDGKTLEKFGEGKYFAIPTDEDMQAFEVLLDSWKLEFT